MADRSEKMKARLPRGFVDRSAEDIRAVEKVTGKKVPYVTAPRRAGDPPALYADSTKAQRELGWRIKFPSIEPIVATAWKWHEANPHGFAAK